MIDDKVNSSLKYDLLIDVSLPVDELEELVQLGILANGSGNHSSLNESYAINASLNRAVYWTPLPGCSRDALRSGRASARSRLHRYRHGDCPRAWHGSGQN